MSPAVQLGFLLLCFVVADSCAASHGRRLKSARLDELMSLGGGSPHKKGDDEKSKGVIRCRLCKRFMRTTMPSISRDLKRKLGRVCHQFVHVYQPFCMKRVMKIHKTVMDFIYPNRSPYEACVKVKMCETKKSSVLV